MNRPFHFALLIVGGILIFYGIKAGDSVGSDVSRAVSGAPTDKAIWLLVGGILSGVVGLFGLLRNSGK